MDFEYGPPTRNAYGEALVELGRQHEEIVVLDGDLAKSTRTYMFQEKFPDRFYNVGIQEANMVGLAAGLAASGLVPFVSSFACFLTNRAYDQLRVSVAYPKLNVKFVASHGGISGGEDGATQQSIEDFALMSSLPGMVVCVPADGYATRALMPQVFSAETSCYMRTCRPRVPQIYDEQSCIELGRANIIRPGDDLTIVACGLLVAEALEVADRLADEGVEVEVIDSHTMKPLDAATLVGSARKTGRVLVAEEHQIWGGLGSAVARALSAREPVPMRFVAIEDTYAESGESRQLLDAYGLTSPHIYEKALELLD